MAGAYEFLDEKTGSGPFRKTAEAKRQHIVFITVDMVPPEFYRPGETNSGLVRTPNIDALRADSVEFTNAFTTSPLCGPSRAAYLTGRYPYILANEERAHDGWAVKLRPDDIIFPQYLKRNGYVAKHVGKSHIGMEKFMEAFGETDAPWNRWAPPMTDDDGYLAYLRSLGVEPPVYTREICGLWPDRKTTGNSYGGFVRQRSGGAFPEEATYPHYLASLAGDRIAAALEQGVRGGAPLYLQVDFFAPHQPFMIPEALESRAAELRDRVCVPETFKEAEKADFARLPGEPRIYELYRRDMGIYGRETALEYIVCNMLEMEILDRAVGKVLQVLKDRGLYDPAMIILAADHGEMNCEKALVDKGVYAHPKVARVPLVLKRPRGVEAGSRVAAPVSLLDIAPTVLESAGITPAGALDGRSLAPLLENARADDEAEWNDRIILYEAFWHVAPNPCIAMQWRLDDGRHYLFVANLVDECDEVYDLNATDYRNLCAEASLSGLRREALLRLYGFLKSDDRWNCYVDPFRLAYPDIVPPEEGDLQKFRPE